MAEKTFWEILLPYTSQLYGKVADLGCNVGTYSIRLREISQITRVIGIDCDPDMGLHFKGEEFLFAPIEKIPLPTKSFDCAICWETLEHTLVPEDALAEIHRTVKDLVIFTTPRPLYGMPDDTHLPIHLRHHHLWSTLGLTNLLTKSGFEVLSTMEFLMSTAYLTRVRDVSSN